MSPAPLADVFRSFLGSLESSRADYFVYGGIAVAVWGNPRETIGVDAVVCIADEEAPVLIQVLETAGFACSAKAKATFTIDGWLRFVYRGRHADVALGRTPFDRSALSRRQRVKLFGSEVWIVSAEDLILYKLVAYRYKDLGDAEAVLVRQRGRLDLDYLRRWATEIAVHTNKFEVPQKLEELLERTSIQ